MPKVIPKEIKEYLDYNKLTGIFTWIKKTNKYSNINIEDIAGSIIKDSDNLYYVTIKFKQISYQAHRVAYWWITGKNPNKIDHINGNGLDNYFSNLREATSNQNAYNQKLHKNNTTGCKGVTCTNRNKNPFKATARINGVRKHLGVFATKQEAAEAYEKYAVKNHKQFYNYTETN